MSWIKKEACRVEVLYYIFIGVVIDMSWALLALSVVDLLGLEIPIPPGAPREITASYVAFIPLMALIEEVVFRAPLIGLVMRGWSIERVITAAALLSVLFGFIHGSIHHVYLQGVGGFIYSLVFLKCGGAQGNMKKALFASTATHSLFNFTVVFTASLGG